MHKLNYRGIDQLLRLALGAFPMSRRCWWGSGCRVIAIKARPVIGDRALLADEELLATARLLLSTADHATYAIAASRYAPGAVPVTFRNFLHPRLKTHENGI